MRYNFFFFFSSRRRHTRYWRDWSSDVCSSDLNPFARIHWRASLVPAAAVIPAPIAYIKVAAVKKLVVGSWERAGGPPRGEPRSEEHTSELQSRQYLVCRLLLEKKKKSQFIHVVD